MSRGGAAGSRAVCSAAGHHDTANRRARYRRPADCQQKPGQKHCLSRPTTDTAPDDSTRRRRPPHLIRRESTRPCGEGQVSAPSAATPGLCAPRTDSRATPTFAERSRRRPPRTRTVHTAAEQRHARVAGRAPNDASYSATAAGGAARFRRVIPRLQPD